MLTASALWWWVVGWLLLLLLLLLHVRLLIQTAITNHPLDGDISDEFTPYSDLKPRMNKYIFYV